jgi:hypothetical protein
MPTLAGQMQVAGASSAAILTGGPTVGGTLAALQAITAGGFNIDVNGVVSEIGPVNFSGAASLAACAALLNTAMTATCTVTYSGTAFVVTTHASGPAATLTYASAPSGATVEADVSATCLLTSGTAASLTQGATGGALNPQWVPCRGQYIRPRTPFGTPRPHAGLETWSTGTHYDYWLRVGRWGGAHGIVVKPDTLRIPYDPSGSYYVSIADDSSETTLPSPPTVQKPPPGVR